MSEVEKEIKNGGYFGMLAEKLVANGYAVIPIPHGCKGPDMGGWQKLQPDDNLVKRWIKQGHGGFGIGIISKNTPAVDIDVKDVEVSNRMRDWCHEHIGPAPVRIGSAPKQLLVYRTDDSFRKCKSMTFVDEWEDRHHVEILGHGQQFVAYHIHPDTKRPYTWPDTNPELVPVEQLTVLNANDARRIIEEFERVAKAEGWVKVANGSFGGVSADGDPDDPFAADREKANIELAKLHEYLLIVPGNDEYQRWVDVGMALFHQTDGDYDGLDMWMEWSSTAENYDRRACEQKWRSFNISNKSRTPITARSIILWAKEASDTLSAELTIDLTQAFADTKTRLEWDAVIKRTRQAEIDHFSREALAEAAKEAYVRVVGSKVSIQSIRKAMSYELNTDEMPEWCRDWVYDADDDRFFNVESKINVSKQGFDAMHNRHSLTKKDILDGKSSPSSSASELALNVYRIPTVNGRMYYPGRDGVFEYCGNPRANTYPEHLVPQLPVKILPRDKLNVQRVAAHIEHMLECDREQGILLSWLAYVVQNPGKRVNWAIILQGTEGDGKSFFAFLLRAVMGMPNVSMLNASSFDSPFTGWGEGQCVLAIEELRLQGEGRFEVLNKIKPFITNSVVEIHAKGRTQFSTENMTSYIGFTNFRNALPLDDNDRRYCVLFSRWQSKLALDEFIDENHDYYKKLYAGLEESAPAIRKWLLDSEFHADFDPRGHAPWTMAHEVMVNAALPEQIHFLNDLIAENNYADIGPQLVSVTRLNYLLGQDAPKGSAWKTIMERAGWMLINGQLNIDGDRCRMYSKVPEMFTEDGSALGRASVLKVQAFLRRRLKTISPFEDEEL